MKSKFIHFSIMLILFLLSFCYSQSITKEKLDPNVVENLNQTQREQAEYYENLLSPQNEVDSLRSLMLKTYATDDGDYIASITLFPQHYLDSNGDWQDVNASLARGSGKTGYYCGTNTVQSFFPEKSGEATILQHHITGTEFGWKKTGFTYTNSYGENIVISGFGDVSAKKVDNKVLYEEVTAFVNEEYNPIDNGLVHNFILKKDAIKDIPRMETMGTIHTLNIEFELVYSEELYFREKQVYIEKGLAPSTEIMVSTANDTLFRLLPPVAIDAAGEKVACAYNLNRLSEPHRLMVQVPLEWVMASTRVFPITIDPDIYIYCHGYSGFSWRHYETDFWGSCNTREYYTYTNMIMAGRGANNGSESNECDVVYGCDWTEDEDRGFAEFDISGINDVVVIVDVDLRFYTTEVCSDPDGSFTYLDFYHLGYRPSTVGSSTQWSDAGDGTQYYHLYLDDPSDDVGWQLADLGSSGNSHLQGRLSANWFGVGFDNYYVYPGGGFSDEVKIRNHTYSSSSYHPNLLVRYSYAQDGYEADNSCYDYTTITPSTSTQSQYHTISPTWNESSWQHDYDYFRFYAECGRRYYFYASSNSWSGGLTDTYGELYTDDCATRLAYDDDGGGSLNFSLNWCCTSTGYYKFRVRGYSASTSLGPYYFNYYYISPADCNQDGYEVDNTCEVADPISPGATSTNHSLNQEGTDVDWMTFNVPYLSDFYVYTTGSSGDTRMWLYRGTCSSLTEIGYDDNSGTGNFSRLDVTCQPAGQYYIRVTGNGNVCSYDIYVSTMTDMRVGTSTLSAPSSGSRTVGNSVNFSWSSASGATNYRLYVNGSLVYNGPNTYYNGYITSDCQNYTWYVEPYNACTYTTSSTFNFRENGHPSVPALASPASGSRNVGNTVDLTWNASSDCDGDGRDYDVYFGRTSPPPFYTNTTALSVTVTTGDCSTYYWRVEASDGYESSGLSALWNFTENGVPEPPTLSYPVNGDSIEPEIDTLKWNAASDCNSDGLTYAWYLDYENPPVSPYFRSGIAAGLISTSIDFSGCGGDTLYWRVFASDGFESGDWSPTWHFFVMFPKSDVTVETDIPGGIVTVDGTDYPSPYTTRWVIGSVHEISVPSPQLESGGIRYVFDHWSDGGAITHDITVPDVNITYTAYMLAQYYITVTNEPLEGGDGEVIVDGSYETAPFYAWWDEGSAHDIEAIDSFTVGDTRYIWEDWSDGGAIAHTIMVMTDMTYTAHFQIQHYLTVNDGGHGTAIGEGWYAQGSSPAFSFDSIADTDAGTRFRFNGWVGVGPGAYNGSNNPANCTMNGPITETATWVVQYRFIVSNPTFADDPEPPVGIYWYDTGTVLNGHVNLIDTIAHVYSVGYIGTGSLGSDIDTSFTFTIYSPSTVEWQWATQVWLIVTSEYGSPVPAGTTWYIPGTNINASVPSPVYFGPDIRALCLGWTGTGSVPGAGATNSVDFLILENSTLTWLWELQYRFVVNNPGGHDTPEPPAGEHWYEEGSYLEGYINSHVDTFYCIGYTGGGILPSAPGTTFAFYLTGPASITWNWEGESNIRLLNIRSLYNYCYPPAGEYYYLLGSEVYAFVIPPIVVDPVDSGIRYVCLGYTGTGSVFPDSSDTNEIRFNINENSTINWRWMVQYFFVVMNPDSMGDPDPPVGEYWMDEGTTIDGSITSPVDTFFCTGFIGTGSLLSGYTTFFSFEIYAPSSVTWLWEASAIPFQVISDYGTPEPPVGTTYHGPGALITATGGPPHPIAPGDRMLCVGWEGTGSVPATGDSGIFTFAILETSSVTWQWQLQYRLTVSSDHGSPFPAVGEHWYNRSATVDGWVELMVVEGTDTFYCSGYTGTGSLGDGADTFFTFDILMASTVDWRWVLSSEAVILDVISDHGDPSPTIGRHYYLLGTEIVASVPTPSYELDGERWLNTGWVGTGSVPLTGDSNRVRFTLDDTSSITWNWRIQYRFTVVSPFDDPYPSVGEHWYDPGTLICGWINRFDGVQVCTGYDGEGSLGDGVDTTFCFNIDTTSYITWNWILFVESKSLVVVSEFGDPYPGRGISYYAPGTEVHPNLPETLLTMGDTRAVFSHWEGTGSVPDSGNATDFTFTIEENSTLTWLWYMQYYLELTYAGTGIYIPIQTGEGWYTEGTVAPIYTDSIVGVEGDWYIFMNWTSDLVGADFVDSAFHETGVTMDTCYDLTANYMQALRMMIRKRPIHREGFIMIDSTFYYDSSSAYRWVAPGSFHELEVSRADTTDTTRYYFETWTGGASTINTIVGPIVSDTTINAFYNCVYFCTVKKDPAQEIGFLAVDRAMWIGPGSSEQSFWWEQGSSHYLETSLLDYDDDSVMYGLIRWSDGGDQRHWTAPISAPTEFIAYYYKAYHCIVLKEPPHNYGTITLEDTIYDDSTEVHFWGMQDSTYFIGVSEIDLTPFWLYTFDYWDHGGTREQISPPITMPTIFQANYTVIPVNVRFSLDPNTWLLGEMDVNDYRTMRYEEIFTIENTGSVPIDFGLIVTDGGDFWHPSYMPEYNAFVLRSRFEDSLFIPTEYHSSRDYVKSSITWATDLIFGTSGYDIPVGETIYLSMQFLSPLGSTEYMTEQVIIVEVRAVISLP